MSGTKILYIHGWATDAWTWRSAAERIGASCINMTLPGHGVSARWDTPTLDPGVRECARLAAPELPGTLVGIGWSLGGQVLLASAMREPGRFKALILVGVTPRFVASKDFPCGQRPGVVRRMITDMRKDPATTLERFYGLNFTEDELKGIEAAGFLQRYKYPGPVDCNTDRPGCFPAFRYAEITAALEALYSTDLCDSLSKLNLPVLVIHGSADAVTPVRASEYLAGHIKGAQLVVMDDAGHCPHLTQPDEFAKTVKRFLGSL
ncbi:MAG: alpha/beta fold hydrolase [Deltaproteobacteria bacterium]|nr:alpha/beta fold hydrolase [Deltaproteobacteria bacterium]